MTAIQRYNRSGPFWDFVADQQQRQGQEHSRPIWGQRPGAQRRRTTDGSDNEKEARASSMPMRGKHGHGHGPGRHVRHAAQDVEMHDPTSETDNEMNAAAASEVRGFSDSEGEKTPSGDEGRRGPGKHGGRGGRMGMGMGGRGRGFGFGGGHGRGGRGGGMGGGPRARSVGAGPFGRHAQSDDEGVRSGDECRRGHGFEGRGGPMGGRGRGFGGPRARAAGAGPFEVRHSMQFDGERMGPRHRHGWAHGAREAGAARNLSADSQTIAPSDEEKGVSGDETPQDKAARQAERRGARMAARNEGAGMGKRGHHGPHGHGHGHGHHGFMHGCGPIGGDAGQGKWKPEADVFDHPEAFVVHVSVAGAKKDDVEVNWDAEKSALVISGTITRPGDEEVLKTIAMNERRVGEFKRLVRLGNRANPASVDVEAISAKIEDGLLRVEVPKLDTGYVEIKKVDIA